MNFIFIIHAGKLHATDNARKLHATDVARPDQRFQLLFILGEDRCLQIGI
ncbi:MAG TPA: hypothetical protein VIO59_07450 [Rhodanobacter sp.]